MNEMAHILEILSQSTKAFIWIILSAKFWSGLDVVSFWVMKAKHLGSAERISWLLIFWLLVLPGHQQPRYWLCYKKKVCMFHEEDFIYLLHLSTEKWYKMEIYIYVSRDNCSLTRVKGFHKVVMPLCGDLPLNVSVLRWPNIDTCHDIGKMGIDLHMASHIYL